MAESKTTSQSHSAGIGLSYQPPSVPRTDSQNMSIQTHNLKEHTDLCPMATNTYSNEKETNAEISQPAQNRYYLRQYNVFSINRV